MADAFSFEDALEDKPSPPANGSFSFEDLLGPAKAEAAEAPAKPASFSFDEAKKPPSGPMPGFFSAIGQGALSGLSDVQQSGTAITGGKPEPEKEISPAAEPYEWNDLWDPSRGLSKTAYRLAKSSPTLAAGIAGGAAGAATPVLGGALIGGATGAGLGAAFQTIGPVFGAELKKTPDDPDGAWNRAMEHAAVSGLFSGAGWAAFPLKIAQGPLKNLAFQAFGVQPAIGATEKATQNVISGKPISEGQGESYVESAVGTLVPALGHKILEGSKPPVAPTRPAVQDQLLQSSEYKLDLAQQTRDLANTPGTSSTDELRLKQQANTIEEEGRFEKFLGNMPTDNYQDKTIKGKVVDSYIANFQPELFSDKALVADAKTAQNRAEYAQLQDSIMKRSDERRYDWNKVPEDDRSTFFQAFETDPKTWSPGFTQKYTDLVQKHPFVTEDAKLLRQWLFDSYMAEKDSGSKAEYIINYLPHQFKQPKQAQKFFENAMSPQGMGPTWFQKARFYDTVELARQNGLELVSTNPFDMVTSRLLSGADMRAKMNWLNEAYGMGLAIPREQAPSILMNSKGQSIPWQQISAPNGKQWMLAPDVQALWKNGMDAKGMWARPDLIGDAFRGWMGLKAAWVPIKLGLSLFHPVHVFHINAMENMSRALHETFGPGTPGAWNRLKALPEAGMQTVLDTFLAFPWGVPFSRNLTGNSLYLPARTFLGKEIKEAHLTHPDEQTQRQEYLSGIMKEAGVSPQLSEQLRTSGERSFFDAVQNGEWRKATVGTLASPLPAARMAIGTLSKPIFEHWIPNLKAAAVMRETESLTRRRPDIMNDPEKRAVAMRAIGKQIDNRFGEMFYSSLFWNRTMKDTAIGSFLSLGWNLGFARDFVGGALSPAVRRFMDNPTPNRQAVRDVTNKATNVFMYAASAMMFNAVLNKAFTGDNPEGMDYIFPRIGGLNPDGSPRRITNPFYTREVPMAAKHIDEAQSVKMGLLEMLKNKLMFSPFIEMFSNKDYFGNQIWNEDSPYFQQWGQLGKHVLTEQLNPMSIAGAKRALQLSGKPFGFADVVKQATDRDVVMPMLGFGPAPAYASRDSIQNQIQHLARQYVYPSDKPFKEAAQMKERGDARIAYKQAMLSKDPEKISETAKKLSELGVTSASIRKIQPGMETRNAFQRLGSAVPSKQIELLKKMSPEQFRFYFPMANRKKVMADPEIRGLAQHYMAQQP